MKTYLDNLRPFERRVVVAVAVMVFVVLNLAFVFPHFSDWGRAKARMAEAQFKLAKYETEIARISEYEREVRKLESQGSTVPPEDQAADFSRAFQLEAGRAHVNIININKMTERTNLQFFVEKIQPLSVQSGEEQLVDFLYKLGSGDSQIRVRGLSLHPDPPRQNLSANLTLVASYRKNLPARKAAPAAASAPAAKSTATPKSTAQSPTTAKKK